MTSTVRLSWERPKQYEQWNDVAAWAIEYFGLPGDRYICRANVYHMDYIFNSNKDALMMALMWNAPVVTDDELTVEFVGDMLNAV